MKGRNDRIEVNDMKSDDEQKAMKLLTGMGMFREQKTVNSRK